MENNLFNSGTYYDLFYSDKNYEKEANYIHEKLLKYNVSCKTILELGCGTGKHALTLSKLGYKIVGIEQSKSMINSAQKIKNFECREGDIRTIKIKEKFDSVISLFHVISYQVTNESLQDVFRTAYSVLKKNGLFLFDVWYAPAVIHQKPELRIKKISTKTHTITRIADPELLVNNNQVNVKYTFYDFKNISNKFKITEEVHPMRFFSIPELDFFANKAGFNIIETQELITGKQPSINTWGICFILKKNNG